MLGGIWFLLEKLCVFLFAFEGIMDLQEFFVAHPKVALAFSGGVDSAYLLYVAITNKVDVKGKPSWSGQACSMIVNGCGLFENVDLVYIGKEDVSDLNLDIPVYGMVKNNKHMKTKAIAYCTSHHLWYCQNCLKEHNHNYSLKNTH